jgi:hypothetical protein
MLKRLQGFIIGFFTCAVLLSGISFAVDELHVAPNPFPILIDGVVTPIEAYNINGFTFLKLGEIGKATNASVKFNEVDRQIEVQKNANEVPITFQNMEAISRNNELYISLSDIIANKDDLLSMMGIQILTAPTPTPAPTPVPTPEPSQQTSGDEAQQGETPIEPTPTPASDTQALINAENARHEAALQAIEDKFTEKKNTISLGYLYPGLLNEVINLNVNETTARLNDLKAQRAALFEIDHLDYYPIDDQIGGLIRLLDYKSYYNAIVKERDDSIAAENALHQQNLSDIE